LSLSTFIARRYFFSGKKKSFISVLTNLSTMGVAITTTALIIVLSVFNGLEDYTRKLFSTLNPDFIIEAKKGKFFNPDQNLVAELSDIPGVAGVAFVLEDQALINYKEKVKTIQLKGIDTSFLRLYGFDSLIVAGDTEVYNSEMPGVLLGGALEFELGIELENVFRPIEFWYPKADFRIGLNPEKAFNKIRALPQGIFESDPKFDQKYLLVPKPLAERLFEQDSSMVSSLDLMTHKGLKRRDKREIQEKTQKLLARYDSNLEVKNLDEQQAGILRALRIERLFAWGTFAVVILVASLNIFFSLAMLIVDKRKEIGMLFSMGATRGLIRKIFLWEGMLIALIGVTAGLFLGFILVYIQLKFKLVGLGVESTLVDAYPVKLSPWDFLVAGGIVTLVTVLISVYPSKKASSISAIETMR
jgi:lipoprotein-releasing system permease protein